MSITSSHSSGSHSVRFVVLLYASPAQALPSQSALSFCQTALDQGHTIAAVYFYHDAVWHVCESSSKEGLDGWQTLARRGVALLACQAAGQRRGLDVERAPDGFEWAGLPRFYGLVDESVRLLSFGHGTADSP